jgi:hypothetical protein
VKWRKCDKGRVERMIISEVSKKNEMEKGG